jgi:hypothetical protein
MDYDRDMFATLAGGYPRPAGLPSEQALAAVLRAQVEAGFGLLSDGLVHPASETAGELVAAWRLVRDTAARLVGLDIPTAGPATAGGTGTPPPAKLAVTGPWAAAGHARALEAARDLNLSLRALADADCPLVEVHEPSASLPGDEAGRSAFVAAHAALLEGVDARIHASLAIVGGDAVALGAAAAFAAPYRSYLFDLLDGPESWRLVAVAPGERGIVVGVGDAQGRGRTRLEDVVWAARYAASTQGRGMDRVGIAPSGGLASLPFEHARSVLEMLGEAARVIAGGPEEILARLDPRAIDARSAALGHYQPGRRPPGR